MELHQDMTVQVRQNAYGPYLADEDGNVIRGVKAFNLYADANGKLPTITAELGVFEITDVKGKATWLGLEDVPTEALIQELQRREYVVEVKFDWDFNDPDISDA